MNRKIEKRIGKKGKKKRFYLSIFAFVMLLFVPVFVYASEIKSDGKTTQVIEEENKTVRKENTYYCNDGKCICRGCTGCIECWNG